MVAQEEAPDLYPLDRRLAELHPGMEALEQALEMGLAELLPGTALVPRHPALLRPLDMSQRPWEREWRHIPIFSPSLS